MFSKTNMGWYFFSEILQNWDWTMVFIRLKIHFEPAGGAWIGHSCPQAFTSSAGHQIWNWLQCWAWEEALECSRSWKVHLPQEWSLYIYFSFGEHKSALESCQRYISCQKLIFLIFFLNNRGFLIWCKAYIASFVVTLCCYASLGKETVPVLSRLKLLKLF